jgi:hypothetical protein
MFQNGPATLHLGKLQEEVDKIRRMALEDRTGVFNKSSDSPSFPTSPYKNFDVRDLDKP